MAAALVGAVVLALTLTGCSQLLPGAFPRVIEPSIVPAADQHGSQVASRDFDFEDRVVQLRVPIDRAVYAGARSAEKSTVFLGLSLIHI